ncbi:hypothetical protein [Noviherbaspirillum soli]|uniref:hypothetical protein n=1 Tax=Noviherbaspirillum soli TaxID=1064518 RepID=UPI00188C92F7|nr:hypothetical protein [Noviherbaspirillum soli]
MRMNLDLDELPALVRLAGDEGVESLSVQHRCHDFGEDSPPAQYQPMRAFINGQTLLGMNGPGLMRYSPWPAPWPNGWVSRCACPT